MYKHNECEYPPYSPPSDESLLLLHEKAETALLRAFKVLGWNPDEYYIILCTTIEGLAA